jgi:hypothetical protein
MEKYFINDHSCERDIFEKSRGVAYPIIRKKMFRLPVHAILRILSRTMKLRVGMHPQYIIQL